MKNYTVGYIENCYPLRYANCEEFHSEMKFYNEEDAVSLCRFLNKKLEEARQSKRGYRKATWRKKYSFDVWGGYIKYIIQIDYDDIYRD